MPDQSTLQPSPMLGDNMPDWAAEESSRLAIEYRGLESDVSNAEEESSLLPVAVDTEETANLYTRMIKRLRDLDRRIEALRESEKAPHLRRENAVDAFFFKLRERVAKRKKNDSDGAADILLARLNAYNQRRLAEEQRKRDDEARLARAEADRLKREAEEAERKRREAEEAAARKRNAEVKAAAQAEADRLAAAAARARADEDIAREKASETRAAAAAKPADLVRERHGDGALNTMREVWHVEIEDAMALDAKTLWPFVKDDAKLQALQSWAKITQYRRTMPGALIEKRSETVVV